MDPFWKEYDFYDMLCQNDIFERKCCEEPRCLWKILKKSYYNWKAQYQLLPNHF